MLDKVLKTLISLLGVLAGYSLVTVLKALNIIQLPVNGWVGLAIYSVPSLIFGIIFLYLSPWIIKKGKSLIGLIEKELQKFSIYDITISSVGLIIGLVIAHLLSTPVYQMGISYIGNVLPIIIYIILGYFGIVIPHKKKEDISGIINSLRKGPREKTKSSSKSSVPKILDTSVIIDGRIADICKTDFIEGPLIIPQFVLGELQHIADSADDLKRARGRRGLDILNKIQKELDIEVIVSDKDFDDIKEVDSKLLKLTQVLKGKIITNDYNLNKVAEVKGISVLNINELANAVKPVVLPGEEMQVLVVKDGKESNQGLAYLDDGTMIVVESGKKHIGETIEVIVTSVLQTSAGRMIFAKPNN